MTAHYSGTERCGSVWACPVCSAVIRNTRSEDIERAATNWLTGENVADASTPAKTGGALMFLTLTVRHKRGQPLALTLDAVLKAWSATIRGNPWTKKKAAIGLRGFIRATEITWGQQNGWHPHLHVLLFLDKPLSTSAAADFEGWLYARWKDRIVKQGLAEPSRLRGIDLRAVSGDGTLLAQYLAKVQGETFHETLQEPSRTSVHLELARSDMKSVRGGNGGALRLMPFELLDNDCPLPEKAARELWTEYFEATRGRRAFHWSKGLRELTRVDEDEKSDEEIIAESEAAPQQFLIPGQLWDELKNIPDQMAGVLEAISRGSLGAAEALAYGDLLVMADGEFWVDKRTHRCFTPTEACEFFGLFLLDEEKPDETMWRAVLGSEAETLKLPTDQTTRALSRLLPSPRF